MDVLKTPNSRAVPAEDRPAIAIISNSQTPYRLHLHQRIVAEIPQIKLWSLYTHEVSNSSWEFAAPEEIGPVLFGKGEKSGDQDKLKGAVKEWRRGGRIIRWLKEHEIRFVVMMGYNDAGRLRIIRWCRRNGIPCFLFGDSNIHGDVATGIKALVKKVIVGWVMRSCSGIFTCGTLGQAYFEKYGAKRDRMFFFPYEPDYELIQNQPKEKVEQVRAEYGLAVGRRRIIYSGRLIAVKRVDLLIDAFIAISKERPDWDLVIVGEGPMRSELSAKIPAELAARVKWVGFLDDQTTLSAIYRACDVLVLPSDFEPWALVVNEAAAANLAIISSSVVGAAAELVRDGVNGRIFPKGDLDALVLCLLDVTSAGNVDRMKGNSAAILREWQVRGDPVQGLRNALAVAGIATPAGSAGVSNAVVRR